MRNLVAFSFLVLGFTSLGVAQAESLTGRVEISLQTLPYAELHLEDREKSGSYDLVLINREGVKVRVPKTSRKLVPGEDGETDYHIDTYEIEVTPGLYRLFIPAVPDYRLGNFYLRAGETFRMNLPQFRFAEPKVCINGESVIKTYNMHSPKTPSQQKLRTKKFCEY